MSVCPICQRVSQMYPFRKFGPHPYYIKMTDGRIFVTPPAMTAEIDYAKRTAYACAVKDAATKQFPLTIKW